MKRITTVLLVLSVAIGLPCLGADEAPDAKVNSQTSVIEIADPVWAVDNYDILYVVAPGERSRSTAVTTHPADDLRPRMAIAPDGDAYVVWRRAVATPPVRIRRHNHPHDTWSAASVRRASIGRRPGTMGLIARLRMVSASSNRRVCRRISPV